MLITNSVGDEPGGSPEAGGLAVLIHAFERSRAERSSTGAKAQDLVLSDWQVFVLLSGAAIGCLSAGLAAVITLSSLLT